MSALLHQLDLSGVRIGACETFHPTGSILDPVIIHRLREDLLELAVSWRYCGDGFTIDFPEGFLFDGASVPQLLWWYTDRLQLSVAAVLPHDGFYRYAGSLPAGWMTPYRDFTRSATDTLFRRMMIEEGVPWWRREPAYLAVRVKGGGAWGNSRLPRTP